MNAVVSAQAPLHTSLPCEEVERIVAEVCPADRYLNKRVLMIVPDHTRTAPVGMMFRAVFQQIGEVCHHLDVLIALGTHQPLSEESICVRLEITAEERVTQFGKVRFFNHAWNDPAALTQIGIIASKEIQELSDGLFSMEVPVKINKLIYNYDQVMIVGPVFPHEVVGFSGGNKYLFPGVAGPEILNFFHWLGAVVTNAKIIGTKWTPVRRVVDRAGDLVTVPKLCFCMVVSPKGDFSGLYAGDPQSAWDGASEQSKSLHITYKPKPFRSVLSCAPTMYDELWTGGKCMYKLEPVLDEGAELIIYAPHIREVCITHGKTLLEIGYHCRDYFLKQWDQFKHHPWGVLAHSTHVYGQGTFENGIEKPRARVVLATGIPEKVCRQVNLSYRDPATIQKEDFMDREHEGILYVPKAGEMLFRLDDEPSSSSQTKF